MQQSDPWYNEKVVTSAKKKRDLIVDVSLAGRSASVGAVAGWVWWWRKKRREKARRKMEAKRREESRSEGVEGEEEGKPDLLGSLWSADWWEDAGRRYREA